MVAVVLKDIMRGCFLGCELEKGVESTEIESNESSSRNVLNYKL